MHDHLHMMILVVGWSACSAIASEKPVGYSPAAPQRPWCLSQTTCTGLVPLEPASSYKGSVASSAELVTDSASPWLSPRACGQTLFALSPRGGLFLKHIEQPMWSPWPHSPASSWVGLPQYAAYHASAWGKPADSYPQSFDLSNRYSSFRRCLVVMLTVSLSSWTDRIYLLQSSSWIQF